MPPFTRYDLPFRFERALQPDALRVVATCTIAVNDAIADATNAGLDPERDPAVLLLARHLGRVAAGQDPEAMHDEDRDLRTLCQSRIAALRSADVLIPLVRRGFAHDAHLTKVYRSAARDRLRAVAHALDLEAADYELRARSDQGPVPILDLQADYFRVTIAPERLMPGREVRWLRTASSTGGWEGSATTGEIGVLADIGQFARTLRRTLHLPVAVQPVLLWRKDNTMGWLSMPLSSMHPHSTPKAYLDAQLTYERVIDEPAEAEGEGGPLPSRKGLRVIASSCLRNKVYYAAVAPTTDGVDGPVFAVVCLVRWNPRAKDGYVFAYKDMDETAGPNEAECPERILALLSPTQNHSALQWRRRCIRNLARPTAKLEDGMRIRFASPIKFTDGYEGQEFFVRKRGRKTALAISEHGSARYRVTNMARMSFSVVPQTKVHRTVF